MKRLRTIVVTGCLVLVPIVLTVQVILWVIDTADSSIRTLVPAHLLPFDFRGLGLLMAIVVILTVGAVTQGYIGKWLVASLDSLIRRISFVGGIYGSIKKFLETILNPGSEQFKGAVLVEFPRAGAYSVGFRTGQPDAKLTENVAKNLVNIFVPCTPNPTSGFYILVPEDQLVPLDLSVQEAFKIVISMGIVTSDEIVVVKR